MEPISLRGGECSNTGDIQEKFRQLPGRYPLSCIPALSWELDLMAFEAPSKSIIVWFCGSTIL